MKFSEQWLREWVNPDISTTDLVAQLTMAGLEVDAVEPVAPFFSNVVVGEVISVEPHPAADRLRLCQVNVGDATPLSIVCGASNVAVGARVPVALVGAKLPGGIHIEKSKLRGVPSEGMLCSAKELGLAENAEGLLLLPVDAKPGQDVREYLALSDVSIELGLTPNRGDCLSVLGIARETAVINRCSLQGSALQAAKAIISDRFPVEVASPAACPRYLGRVVSDININASTPIWMQERLRRSGLRSINAVVDITNYVLLELGQPMHAFDLDKLTGGIRVRMAVAGERLTLLDGQEITLDDATLIIADHGAPVAMAGIMGGAATAVGEGTRQLFLESAFFTPAAMAGRARRYGLHTDSSHRFERGVDPELARRAMERATDLLQEIASGKPGPIVEAHSSAHCPAVSSITLRSTRLRRLIGAEIAGAEVTDILQRLGMSVVEENGSWQVTPPSFRFDIRIESDLIEEIARIHGYSRLPSTRPAVRALIPRCPETKIETARIRQCLIERGYQEAITYSFVDPRLQAALDPEHVPFALANPISADMAVMRSSLWPGLMQAVLYNHNRQQGRIRMFEIGTRFRQEGDQVREETVVAAIAVGANEPEQWGMAKRDADFYDVKGDVEALLAMTGRPHEYAFRAETHQALHPGQSALIEGEGGRTVGLIGALHPHTLKIINYNSLPIVFELKLEEINQAVLPRFREASKYPAIRRDIAVVLDDAIASVSIRKVILESSGELLRELQLFDVYKGKGIDSEKKSIALGLTLQDSSRTLTDGDVDIVIDRVLASLREKFGATLRD
jgi:phenylalanyl-tRNA synthetase beta chain